MSGKVMDQPRTYSLFMDQSAQLSSLLGAWQAKDSKLILPYNKDSCQTVQMHWLI